RQHFTFLVIPLLDPDAVAQSSHQGMITSFQPGMTTDESIAYANWFETWVDSRRRLDLVFDLHNVQSRESAHISCPLLDVTPDRASITKDIHERIINHFRDAGYNAALAPWATGTASDRLGGWLSACFGCWMLPYEINSQDAERHLD